MDSEICDKGYKISLKSLPPHFLENIRQELTVKPLENPNFPSNEDSYPVYRISKNSIYLPRYYGLEKYGEPKTSFSKITKNSEESYLKLYLNILNQDLIGENK